ncbi:MAG TPA: hypothetical protein VMD31_07860 [Opitutaceae bacterium]|nr:hypothetical protein [Opitutaceae bacterium]
MPSRPRSVNPASLQLPAELVLILVEAAASYAKDRHRAFQTARRPHVGATVRPGRETPLWNALAAAVRPHLRRHGEQAKLARLLGLDRQAVNAYFKGGSRMPDAERTLQLLTWLIAVRKGTPPG